MKKKIVYIAKTWLFTILMRGYTSWHKTKKNVECRMRKLQNEKNRTKQNSKSCKNFADEQATNSKFCKHNSLFISYFTRSLAERELSSGR